MQIWLISALDDTSAFQKTVIKNYRISLYSDSEETIILGIDTASENAVYASMDNYHSDWWL